MAMHTSWGRINTHLMGNMCVGDEAASLYMNKMKYGPVSCRAPIMAVRTRRGGEAADPPTGSLTQHTHKLPIWPFWIHEEARV